MESWLLAKFTEISAINAEIEGMKAENQYWFAIGQGPVFALESFNKKAQELRQIYEYIMNNR